MLAVTALLLGVVPAFAQTGSQVLVVANANSPASEEIAVYYAGARGVPEDQVLRLDLPVQEQIEREVYTERIEDPIRTWLTAHSAQDRILYFVLIKDVPIRVNGTAGERGSIASVDSELTLLYRRLQGTRSAAVGPVPNPYFAGDAGLLKAERFSHRTHDIYLVARLDGYTAADVKALIARGAAPTRAGRIVLDSRGEVGSPSPGNRWLARAAETLRNMPDWGERVVHDTSATPVRNEKEVLGYYSWGSNDRTTGSRNTGFDFAPGVLAALFVSTDARTFAEPPETWTVNTRPFRGSHQSLAADLIREGVTGVAGHVAEPYLSAAIRPDVLFPAYVSGFNLIEAFYLAMPSLSWQTVIVGDPLCAPFRADGLTEADLDPPIDTVTGLPQFLSERRVALLTATGLDKDAAAWMARSDVLFGRGDTAGAREALERVTSLAPAFTPAHMALAYEHEKAGEWDLAIERYRQVIAQLPNDAMALNNLAYTLAARKENPADALPFARRAYAASSKDAAIIDTLAWVYHLLGQDLDAEPLIVTAATLAPGNAEVQLHAAIILAARAKRDAANAALDRALRIDPALADSSDVAAVRERLKVQ